MTIQLADSYYEVVKYLFWHKHGANWRSLLRSSHAAVQRRTCFSTESYTSLPFTLFLKFNHSKWNKWRLSIKLSDHSLILMSFCFKHVTDAWRILFQTSLHINKAIKLFQTLKNCLVWCHNPCGHLIIVTVSMWNRNQRGSSDMKSGGLIYTYCLYLRAKQSVVPSGG